MINICKITITYLFILLTYQLNGQIIQGTVSSQDGTVPYANILIRKINNPNLIVKYTKTNEAGWYSIEVEPNDSLLVEVTAVNLESQVKRVKVPFNSIKVIIDFYVESKVTILDEVIIESRKNLQRNNDTITYNPESFKDGSEKVVEDLLRKLPGIRILDNGEIKYKGKSIQKFLLDGDDLFDKLYTIGSKNIDVNIVEAVQAIENFNENHLLKGINNSEGVALNLKLKKGKTNLSGTANIGYGFEDKYRSSVTGLLVNQKFKGFAVGAYNNVGINNSPYDFQSSILSVEFLNDGDLEAREIIHQGYFLSQVDEKYRNINKSLYTSTNILYKISSKLTAKVNFGLYDDRFIRRNELNAEYNIKEQEFSLRQTENITKKPLLYTGSLYLSNKPKDNFAWEYKGKINYRETDYQSFTDNNGIYQFNNVNTINLFTRHDLNFTKRINSVSALSGSGVFTKGRAPQSFILIPGVNFEEGYDGSIRQNIQDSRFDKEFYNAKLDYFYSISKEFKLKVNGGYSQAKTFLKSLLTAEREIGIFTDTRYQNNNYYGYNVLNFSSGASYIKRNKFGINFDLDAQYFNMSLLDKIRNTSTNTTKTVISPFFKFAYSLSSKSSVSSSYSYSQLTPTEDNLFNGIILTGYRNFRNNEPDIKFFKTHQYSLSYNYHDFLNLTNLSFSTFYNIRKNNYFYKNIINVENTISTTFLLETGNRDYSFNFEGEQYIHFLRTTLQLESNYSLSYYKNIINNSELRNVETRMLNMGLSLRPAIKGNVNVENKLNYSSNVYFLEGQRQNSFSSIKDTFKVTHKISDKFKGNVIINFIATDLSVSNNYLFADTELTLTSKNKKIEYSLIGRNLTNNRRFETISVSDYYKISSSHNLLDRFILVSVSFRF